MGRGVPGWTERCPISNEGTERCPISNGGTGGPRLDRALPYRQWGRGGVPGPSVLHSGPAQPAPGCGARGGPRPGSAELGAGGGAGGSRGPGPARGERHKAARPRARPHLPGARSDGAWGSPPPAVTRRARAAGRLPGHFLPADRAGPAPPRHPHGNAPPPAGRPGGETEAGGGLGGEVRARAPPPGEEAALGQRCPKELGARLGPAPCLQYSAEPHPPQDRCTRPCSIRAPPRGTSKHLGGEGKTTRPTFPSLATCLDHDPAPSSTFLAVRSRFSALDYAEPTLTHNQGICPCYSGAEFSPLAPSILFHSGSYTKGLCQVWHN
ncbi:collagen alpha-1(I) chain-like [Mauremys reevesii]|uniref:collagen alpha-1(I) chain-like n=1 Tax=Mauremys reevesii TaxID=260615 RepID=UPI00193F3277|nr:collagen alpha-1(I) chain-like [Mauremys reevesii]